MFRWHGDHPGRGEDGPAAEPEAPPGLEGLCQGEPTQGRAGPLARSPSSYPHGLGLKMRQFSAGTCVSAGTAATESEARFLEFLGPVVTYRYGTYDGYFHNSGRARIFVQ
jgi:hypothetical protein